MHVSSLLLAVPSPLCLASVFRILVPLMGGTDRVPALVCTLRVCCRAEHPEHPVHIAAIALLADMLLLLFPTLLLW